MLSKIDILHTDCGNEVTLGGEVDFIFLQLCVLHYTAPAQYMELRTQTFD
jgi:hypothetical protein